MDYNELCPCCDANREECKTLGAEVVALEAKKNTLESLLRRLVDSQVIKEAPFLSYSEAYRDALEYFGMINDCGMVHD